MSLPLAGLRILTVESFGAAPYGSMFLADLGAEVIKIEDPGTGGDASRGVGPHYLGEKGDSHYFQSFNLNKKSLAVNLKDPAGREILHKLASKCDAVFNNLRGDLPEKLGLDYETLKQVNAKIVCVHLSAYGRDNERQARPGYDYLMQAETGAMSATGEPGSPPTRMGLSVVDFMTGLTACIGLLSAVMKARESGEGCNVDTCLFDVSLHQLSYLSTWYLNEGTVMERMPRSAHPIVAPTQLFKTADGWIMVMCMKEKFWEELLETMQRSDLASDDRFNSAAARRENINELTEILDEEFSKGTTAEWIEKLGDSLPAAPVYDLAQALENPYVKAKGMIADVPHPERPDFRTLANPIRINEQRLQSKVCNSLGQDTVDILQEFGFEAEQIENLKRDGVIRQAGDEA